MNKEIRCAHYITTYLPITEKWIYTLLARHNSENTIVLSRKIANISHFPFKKVYSLYSINLLRKIFNLLVLKVFGFLPYQLKLCKQNNINILHVHFGYNGVKLLGLKRKLKIPMICSFYGVDAYQSPRKWGYKRKYRKLFRHADKIIVLGPEMQKHLIHLGCNEDKLIIHHLGIDPDENSKYVKKYYTIKKSLRILIASSFVKKKGVDIALKSLDNISNKYQFTLDIIGNGPLREEIHNLIEQLDWKDKIKIHGYQPYSFLLQLAQECDVFVQASRTTQSNDKEGTPMVLVDMLSIGIPVVSTYHSDIPEIVNDNKNGFLAQENNVYEFAKALEKIFINQGKLKQLGLNGKIHIEREFNSKIQNERLTQLYYSLIK